MNTSSLLILLCFRYSCNSRCFYTIPVVLLTSIWNIPRFLELQTCYMLNNSKVSFCEMKNSTGSDCQLTLCATELRQNLSYCRDYILIGNFLLMVFFPLLLLGLFNGHIYHTLAQSSRRSSRSNRSSIRCRHQRDQSIAAILVTIVIIFACCNIPRVTINLFEVRISK